MDLMKTAMFFIIKKSEETTFDFPQNSVNVVWFCLIIDYI